MTRLVFGGEGQLGRALGEHDGVVALGRQQCDITDQVQITKAIADFRPSVIINAAAYTAVDRAEDEAATAHLINAVAPGLIAEAAAGSDIPVIHISTDCVFSGRSDVPYKEDDPTGPINVYGASKLEGERAVLSASPANLVVRVSWLFSATGTNFIHVVLRLAEKLDELRIVSDQVGGPTFAPHLARDLLNIADRLDGAGGVYHYSGAPFVSRAEFAREILRLAGLDKSVREIPTSEFPTPAERPLNSRLDCKKIEEKFGLIQPDWREGVVSVLKELKVSPPHG